MQNIIYGKDGLLAYSEYIEDGSFFYVNDSDELSTIFSKPVKMIPEHKSELSSIYNIKANIKLLFNYKNI